MIEFTYFIWLRCNVIFDDVFPHSVQTHGLYTGLYFFRLGRYRTVFGRSDLGKCRALCNAKYSGVLNDFVQMSHENFRSVM